MGISEASILADDLRRSRGGVKGTWRTGTLALRSSSLLLPGFRGGVLVSELFGESVFILSLSLSDSSEMNAFWLRRLACKVKDDAKGLWSLVSPI